MHKRQYIQMLEKDYKIRKSIQMPSLMVFNYVSLNRLCDPKIEYGVEKFKDILFNQSDIIGGIPERNCGDFYDLSRVEFFECLTAMPKKALTSFVKYEF